MKLRFPFVHRRFEPPVPRHSVELPTGRRLLIQPGMLPAGESTNINVPSLIRVPDWIKRPLGRYYLYFGSHSKRPHIRLAYAERIEGPWRIRPEGSLRVDQLPFASSYVGAPDVHVDHAGQQIRMYFHASSARDGRARAFLAVSQNGLDFHAGPAALGAFYFRAFPWRGAWYAMSKGGRLYRSEDGVSHFVRGGDAFDPIPGNGSNYNAPGSVRHLSVEPCTTHVSIFYTRIGDAPERILKSRLDLGGDWRRWRATWPEEVMRAEEPWEGGDLPIVPSDFGAARGPVNQLRDPEIFVDQDGSRYLLYAAAGEQGIGMARL